MIAIVRASLKRLGGVKVVDLRARVRRLRPEAEEIP